MEIHSSSRRGFLISAASLLPAAQLLRGQAPDSTFSTGVNVVNVFATVRNGKGDLVHDLAKEDFTLEEEGRPQTITYFSRDSNLPLTLGLLVDTSASQRRVLDQEKSSSREFMRHVLREDRDHAFLIHFDREVELLQDLTSSRTDLEKALASLDTPQLRRQGDNRDGDGDSRNGGGGYPRNGGGGRRGGTALYDAILLASNELMAKQTGRKALIILTDGVDNGSKTSIDSAIEAAQRADTLVYSIYFTDEEGYGGDRRGGFGGGGLGGGIGGGGGMGGGGMGRRGGGGMGRRGPDSGPRPDGKKILQRISTETGGAMFEVSKKHPLDEIYDKIEAELRNQYSLGFSPDPKGISGYRKIHLTAKGKGFTVQARSGFYYSS